MEDNRVSDTSYFAEFDLKTAYPAMLLTNTTQKYNTEYNTESFRNEET